MQRFNCLPYDRQGGYGVGYLQTRNNPPWKPETRKSLEEPYEVSPAKCVPWLDNPDLRINSPAHQVSLDSNPSSVKGHFNLPKVCQQKSTYHHDSQNSAYFRKSNVQPRVCCPKFFQEVESKVSQEPLKESNHEKKQEQCDNLKLVISSDRNGEQTLVIPSDILLKCLGMFLRDFDKEERVNSKRMEKQESSNCGLSGPVDFWAIVSFLYQLLMQFAVFFSSCAESSSSEVFHAKSQKQSEKVKAIHQSPRHEPMVTSVDADGKNKAAGDQSKDTETNKFLTLDETNTYRRRLPPPSLDLKFICEDIIPKQCVLKVCGPEVDMNLDPCPKFSDENEEEVEEEEEEIEDDETLDEKRPKKHSMKPGSVGSKKPRKGKIWKKCFPCIKGERNSESDSLLGSP